MIEIKELTREDLEGMILVNDLACSLLGFENFEDFCKQRYQASEGLRRFGGSFASTLGQLLVYADDPNSFKIYQAFKETWEEHRELFLKWEEKNG